MICTIKSRIKTFVKIGGNIVEVAHPFEETQENTYFTSAENQKIPVFFTVEDSGSISTLRKIIIKSH